MIAIAHRLQTIMDFDEVIVRTRLQRCNFCCVILLCQVMGACSDRPGGKVLEKDSPKNLLHNHKSVCVKMGFCLCSISVHVCDHLFFLFLENDKCFEL